MFSRLASTTFKVYRLFSQVLLRPSISLLLGSQTILRARERQRGHKEPPLQHEKNDQEGHQARSGESRVKEDQESFQPEIPLLRAGHRRLQWSRLLLHSSDYG